MPFLLRVASLFLALGLIAAAAPPASAQSDLAGLKGSLTTLQRDARNLDTAIEQQAAENSRIMASINSQQTGARVSFEELRQAQFEVDIARTRLLTLQHRIAEQTTRLDQLAARVVTLNAELTSSPSDTLERIVRDEALEWTTRIRTAAGTLVDRLTRYQELSADNLALRQEQLSIAQRLIGLDALQGLDPAEDDPLVARLRALVDTLAQNALALSNEATAVGESNPAAVQRRNVLRLRSDEALLRSNARLTDVAIVEARQMVAALRPLRNEPAVPTRLFDEALDALDAQSEALNQRIATIAASRSALNDVGRIVGEARDEAGGSEGLARRISNLRDLLSMQESEIGALSEEIASTRDALTNERTKRERSSLLERQVARTDKAARERIRDELAEVPGELTALYGSRYAEVKSAVEVANPRRYALFGVAALALLAITLYLRERLLKRFVAADATRATEIPLEVLRRNLFWLFPVALWALFMEFFAISRTTGFQILTLLAIPAAAASLRDLTQVIVVRRSRGEQRRIGILITRAMAVAMLIVSLVVFTYAVLNELTLLPSTELALNRLAYSVFVLGGLPMLLFVFFFTSSDGNRPLRGLIAGTLSLLPPLALIATGVAGLAGYTTLSELMLKNLSIAIAIAAALALALGILNDILEGVAARMRAEDPARAYFMRHNFLQPLARFGQFVLVIIAIIITARIFGWTGETMGVRETLQVWNTTLFTVGGTEYSVGSVILAIAALAFVFWAGAWSRRVAYTVVFGRLKDIGIRQSLSVFAQYVVIVIGVLLTLTAVGFDVTTLTVFAASLGVGIGFGLQNVVNNFISGVLLLVERPLRIGDIVTVGANSGTVSQIGIRSMRMKTFDEFDLIVPNSQLISDSFTNWTRSNSLMRMLMVVGISYDDDPEVAIPIVLDILQNHPGVMPAPAPMVTAEEFGDSSINLRVQFHIDLRGGISGFTVKSEFITQVRRRFAAAGISIPFPQRDVHMIAAKAIAAPAARPAAEPQEPNADKVMESVELADDDPDSGREAF